MITDNIKNRSSILYDIVKNLQVGTPEEKTTDHPFFQPSLDENTVETLFNQKCEKSINEKVVSFSKDNNFPFELKFLYLFLGVDNREIIVNDVSLFSFNELVKRHDNFIEKGQNDIIDLGTKYLGMGHVAVLTLNKKTSKVFLRSDGGSNGYDREINFNKSINIISDDISDDKQCTLLDFIKTPEIIQYID